MRHRIFPQVKRLADLDATKRRNDVRPETVDAIAESIIEDGLKVPISVRRDGQRFVLVAGLQRLEACKALGEETILAIVVGSPQR